MFMNVDLPLPDAPTTAGHEDDGRPAAPAAAAARAFRHRAAVPASAPAAGAGCARTPHSSAVLPLPSATFAGRVLGSVGSAARRRRGAAPVGGRGRTGG